MASQIAGTAQRTINLGTKLSRATATLPQTGNQNIFAVTGGKVLITSLVGEVTTVIGATATNVKITSTPGTGTAVDLTANNAVTSKEVGSMIALAATAGASTVVTNAGGGVQRAEYVVASGNLSYQTSGSTTGSIKWTCTYIPVDDGAAVSVL